MPEDEKKEEQKQEEKQEEKKEEVKTFTLKDGSGTDKIVTLEEMQELATKSAGADEKFREAAKIREDVEGLKDKGVEADKIVKTFGKLFKGGEYDKSDIREFGEMVGLGGDEMEKMFTEELKKSGTSAGAKDDGTPFRKLKVEDLDEETQETLKQAKQSQIAEAEKKIAEMVEKAVDKDEFFGTILKKTDDKQRDDRKAAIEEMVKKDVNRRILQSPYTKEQFGDPMIQGSIQEIRANIKKFGTPSKASEKPVSSLLAGLGLPGDLQTKIQTDEPIERVPVTDDGWMDNFLARLAQKMKVK